MVGRGFPSLSVGSRLVRFESQQIARLAVQNVAELVERAEPDGSRFAGLENREVLDRDADAIRELTESHLASSEHHVEVDDDRHIGADQTASSLSSRSSRPTSMIHENRTMTAPARSSDTGTSG